MMSRWRHIFVWYLLLIAVAVGTALPWQQQDSLRQDWSYFYSSNVRPSPFSCQALQTDSATGTTALLVGQGGRLYGGLRLYFYSAAGETIRTRRIPAAGSFALDRNTNVYYGYSTTTSYYKGPSRTYPQIGKCTKEGVLQWNHYYDGMNSPHPVGFDPAGKLVVLMDGIRKYDTNGDLDWVAMPAAASPQIQSNYIDRAVLDHAGNLYGTVWPGLLVKYSPDGTFRWVQRPGTADSLFSLSYPDLLAMDRSDNLYYVGHVYKGNKSGYGVMACDTNGNERWKALYISTEGSSYPSHVVFGAHNSVYVAGINIRNAPTGYTSITSVDLVKFSEQGSVLWQRTLGGAIGYADQPYDIAVDSAENCYLLSTLTAADSSLPLVLSKYSPVGNLLWSRTYLSDRSWASQPFRLLLTPQNTIMVSGSSYELFMLQYSTEGELLSKSTVFCPNESYDELRTLVFDPWGNLVLAGRSVSETQGDVVLIAINSAGDTVWTTRFDSPIHDDDYPLIMDYAWGGDLSVLCTNPERWDTRPGIRNRPSTYLLQFSSSGRFKWMRQISAEQSHTDLTAAMLHDRNGNIYTAVLHPRAKNDSVAVQLAKVSANGTILWDRTTVIKFTLAQQQDIISFRFTAEGNISLAYKLANSSSCNDIVSPDGNLIATYSDTAKNMELMADAAGNLYGLSVGHITKYSPDWSRQWERAVPTDVFHRMSVSDDGTITLLTKGMGKLVLSAYDSGGSVLWSSSFIPRDSLLAATANENMRIRTDWNKNAYVFICSDRLYTAVFDNAGHLVSSSYNKQSPLNYPTEIVLGGDGSLLLTGSQYTITGTNEANGSPIRVASRMAVIKYAAAGSRTVAGVRNDGGMQASFALSQNYPNPFNPITDIGFRIADIGLVTLKIYNLLGQEMATLVNEVKPPGTYSIKWDAAGTPSGVYFYKLTAGKQTEVRKMVFTR